MNAKKIILILIAAILGFYIVINMIVPDTKYSNNFTATYPKRYSSSDSLKKVTLVVDFSASMRGFIDYNGFQNVTNTTFIQNVSDFLTDYEANYKGTSIVKCGNKEYKKDDFRNDMRSNATFPGSVTKLDDLVEEVIKQVDDTSVGVLLTDMVASYGPKVLKSHGLEYNKLQLGGLASALKSQIVTIKDKYDVMLVQYKSDFNGKYYYNYRENLPDGKSKYAGKLLKQRPYYLLLIGKKEHLVNLYDKCMPKQDDDKFVYTSFNIQQDSTKNKFKVNAKFWKIGTSDLKAVGTLWTKYDLQGDETTFNVTYEGFDLPSFIKPGSLEVKTTLGSSKIKSYNAKDNTIEYTIEFNTDSFKNLGYKNVIDIEVLYKNDKNYSDYSLADDVSQTPESLDGKTWGLEEMLKAIDGAYYGNTVRDNMSVISKTQLQLIKVK